MSRNRLLKFMLAYEIGTRIQVAVFCGKMFLLFY